MPTLPREFDYEYSAIWRFDSFCHRWVIHGPLGAIDFHFDGNEERIAKYGPTAGLECHWRTPPAYMADRAPSHRDCITLRAPCWHDGTSLYATENLFPLVDLRDPLDFFSFLVLEMKRLEEGHANVVSQVMESVKEGS